MRIKQSLEKKFRNWASAKTIRTEQYDKFSEDLLSFEEAEIQNCTRNMSILDRSYCFEEEYSLEEL